jgi:hypothetical protein
MGDGVGGRGGLDYRTASLPIVWESLQLPYTVVCSMQYAVCSMHSVHCSGLPVPCAASAIRYLLSPVSIYPSIHLKALVIFKKVKSFVCCVCVCVSVILCVSVFLLRITEAVINRGV